MKTKNPKPLHNHRLGDSLPMTTILECIKRPDYNLVLYSLPIGTKLKGEVVSVSKTGRIFFLSEKGHLYDLRKGSGATIIEKKEMARYLSRNEMRAFQRLGLMTSKQISEAVKSEKECQAHRDKSRKADHFIDCAKACGIPVREAAKLLRQAAVQP